MLAAVADTHTVVWYLLDSPRLSPAAAAAFESARQNGDAIGIPSITVVEITYLVEKNRVPEQALERLAEALRKEPRLLEVIPLDYGLALSAHDVRREAVPDLPDRIIAATALHLSLPLISRDRQIQASSISTIW